LRHLYKGYVLAREAAESQTKDRNNEVKYKSRISSVFGFDGLCTTVFAVSIKTVSPEERNVSSFSFGVSTASSVRFGISAFIGNFFKHKLVRTPKVTQN
jgi:hypothetical protein